MTEGEGPTVGTVKVINVTEYEMRNRSVSSPCERGTDDTVVLVQHSMILVSQTVKPCQKNFLDIGNKIYYPCLYIVGSKENIIRAL